jgi:hypothetical protein
MKDKISNEDLQEIHSDNEDVRRILNETYWNPDNKKNEMSEKNEGTVTGQQMCELISKYFKEKYNIDKSWEEIWYYSPTGELAKVYYWYEDALDWFREKEKR